MRENLIELVTLLSIPFLVIVALVVWVLTFLAFRKRLKNAAGNRTLTLAETLKYALAPLLAIGIGVFELLYAIFRKFAFIFIILLFPVWGFLLVLFLLWLVLPELIDRLIRNMGVWGEKIMSSIEHFPERTRQRLAASRALLLGDMMIFLTNSPLNRLITSRKAIQGLEILGLQPKAVSILKSAALDPTKPLQVRQNAITSLGRMGCKDDLLDIARNHQIEPSIAYAIPAWLKDNHHIPEYLTAWRLIGRNKDPRVRLEAARKLHLEGITPEAYRILISLAQDQTIEEAVRIQAVDELGYISQATGDTRELSAMLLPGTPPRLQIAAAEAFARMRGQPADMDRILAFIDTNQPIPVRQHAIQALGRLSQRYPLTMISKNRNLTPDERLEACLALENGGLDLPAFVSLWKLALSEDLPLPARIKAFAELGEYGSALFSQGTFSSFQRRRSVLVSLAENESTPVEVRLAIARTLEKWQCEKDAGTIYTLLANSRDIAHGIRSQAKNALKKLETISTDTI